MLICKDLSFPGWYVIINKHGMIVTSFDDLGRAKAAYPTATMGPDYNDDAGNE